ncbi:hypothetical protein [Moorena sp. SIO3I8]|uniref:hypothetical protein n=1 Tax=Moorena sp. SIO3I8 TaxID=2607833 RepID=UPI0013C29E2F|nr:hypothetical protein [Moorena sp. SIO3I8]NEO06284.1 hypothetical protein [Moorena sp. SIO3I8]
MIVKKIKNYPKIGCQLDIYKVIYLKYKTYDRLEQKLLISGIMAIIYMMFCGF